MVMMRRRRRPRGGVLGRSRTVAGRRCSRASSRTSPCRRRGSGGARGPATTRLLGPVPRTFGRRERPPAAQADDQSAHSKSGPGRRALRGFASITRAPSPFPKRNGKMWRESHLLCGVAAAACLFACFGSILQAAAVTCGLAHGRRDAHREARHGVRGDAQAARDDALGERRADGAPRRRRSRVPRHVAQGGARGEVTGESAARFRRRRRFALGHGD